MNHTNFVSRFGAILANAHEFFKCVIGGPWVLSVRVLTA